MAKSINQKEQKMYLPVDDINECLWTPQNGKTLKALRGKLTQQQLADKIIELGYGCTERNIRYLETGKSKAVSMRLVLKICEAIGTSPQSLLNVRVLAD